jgi:hypothetical protein
MNIRSMTSLHAKWRRCCGPAGRGDLAARAGSHEIETKRPFHA